MNIGHFLLKLEQSTLVLRSTDVAAEVYLREHTLYLPQWPKIGHVYLYVKNIIKDNGRSLVNQIRTI